MAFSKPVLLCYLQAEMDALKRTQDDLIKGKQKLETMVTNMEKEQVSAVTPLSIVLACRESGGHLHTQNP